MSASLSLDAGARISACGSFRRVPSRNALSCDVMYAADCPAIPGNAAPTPTPPGPWHCTQPGTPFDHAPRVASQPPGAEAGNAVCADVGVAIGAGTDVAVEAGDVVLVRSDPRDVPRIVNLSRASYRKMVQNLWWAAGYNIVAIPLAAGVLAPWGIVLTPAVGAVLMSLSTIVVAINAQLLRRAHL